MIDPLLYIMLIVTYLVISIRVVVLVITENYNYNQKSLYYYEEAINIE